MANLSAIIGADTSKFVNEIKSAQEMLNKFVDATNSASNSVDKNVSYTNEQVNAYKRVVKQLEKVASGNMSTAQQTKALENQVKELKIQWANLSDEAKKSDFGKAISGSLQSASTQLNTLKEQINQASDTIKDSSKNTSDFDGSLGGLLNICKKLAPAVGGLVGAQKLFKEVIGASQTTSDAYNNVLSTSQTLMKELASAVATFDFSNFTNGLDAIIKKGWDAASAIDQLGNTIMSYNVTTAKANQKLSAARAILSDPNSTKEQVAQAKKDMKEALDELKGAASVMMADYENVIITEVNSRGGSLSGEGAISILDKWLEVDSTANRDKIKEAAKAGYDAYVQELSNLQKQYSVTENVYRNGASYTTSRLEKTPEYTAALNALSEQYKEQIAYHVLLEKYSDEELQNLGQQRIAMINLNGQIDSYAAAMNKLNNKKLPTVGGDSGKTDKIAEAAKALRKQNEELGKLEKINIPFLNNSVNAPSSGLAGLSPLENIKKQLADFEEYYKATMDRMVGYSSALYGISDVFDALAGVIGDSGAEWMKFASNATQAIARIIPEIQRLILANQGKAIAEGTANAAALPFPANLLAITSIVAEILSIFSALPKFATGGIVGGNTSLGDYNIARVNSGEMILNGRQQKRLFNLLDGSETMTGANAGAGQVEFKIRGTDLVGCLNNTRSKKNKI